MIESGFYQALSGDGAVSGLVGARIFRVFRKDLPLPSIVFQMATRGAVHSFDGRNGLEIGRYQFDSYADNPDTAILIVDAIKTLFVPLDTRARNYPYQLPDGSSVTSAAIRVEGDLGPEIGEGGGYIFRRMVDIEFSFVSS